MTIKNVRQFNNSLSAFFDAGIDGITDILTFSVQMIEKHGNKERLQSFFNHPQLRTQNGKIRAQFKRQAQYMLNAVVAIEIGYFVYDETKKKEVFKKYSLDTLPINITGKDIHVNKDKSFEFKGFDEWINAATQGADDDPKPVKPITVKAFCNQLSAVIERGLKGDNVDLDAASDLLKQVLNKIAAAYVADDAATVAAAEQLIVVPPSTKSKSAGLKKVS